MQKLVACAIVVVGLLQGSGPVAAQTPGPGGSSFVGRTTPTPGCPGVELHVIREGSALSGVVFYPDGSGVSSIQGSIQQGGAFSWHQTSIKGSGPAGDVTGTVTQDGKLKAKLTGTICSFETTLPMLNENSNG